MIINKAQPTFEDEEKVYVYDIDEGANFRLRIKTVESYPNYDSSVFDSPSPLCGGDDDEIQKVIDQYIPLAEFIQPSQFKSAEQLKKEFDRAMGFGGESVGKASDLVNQDKEPEKTPKKEEKAPWDDEIKIPEKKSTKEAKPEKVAPKVETEDADDDMAMFREMLKG